MKVLVLGVGNVGRVVVWDLRDEFEVYVGDIDGEKLKVVGEFVIFLKVNVVNFEELVEVMKSFDFVVGILFGRFGYGLIKVVIKVGVDMVDVFFMFENLFELKEGVEKVNVIVIFDVGFVLGLSYILMGRIWN